MRKQAEHLDCPGAKLRGERGLALQKGYLLTDLLHQRIVLAPAFGDHAVEQVLKLAGYPGVELAARLLVAALGCTDSELLTGVDSPVREASCVWRLVA